MATRSGFDISGLIAKAQRVPDLIERQLTPVLEKESRLFVKEIIKWMPPASQGVTGKKAHEQGKAAVARDIKRVFALNGYAYGTIRSAAARSAYWMLTKKRKFEDAQRILREQSYNVRLQHAEIAARPDESLHAGVRNARGRVKPSQPVRQVIVNEGTLNAYIRRRQRNVGILAAGWNAAARRFGYKPPAWIAKHGTTDGSAMPVKGADKFYFELRNAVGYGAAHAIQDKVNRVLRYRKRAIQAAAAGALRAGLRGAGFSRVRSTGVALAA